MSKLLDGRRATEGETVLRDLFKQTYHPDHLDFYGWLEAGLPSGLDETPADDLLIAEERARRGFASPDFPTLYPVRLPAD